VKSKLKKNQSPQLKLGKRSGVVIECEELIISVFAPPREHGKAHCHVRSKRAYKASGKGLEVFPEVKVFLDGSGVVVTTKGFSLKDINVILETIFNTTAHDIPTNDKFLLTTWENLHGQS